MAESGKVSPSLWVYNLDNARRDHTMADRSLRGMRLGSQSLQSEEGVVFSPRKTSTYRAADGTTFEVIFSSDAEVPTVWESPKSGVEGRLVDDAGELVKSDKADEKI